MIKMTDSTVRSLCLVIAFLFAALVGVTAGLLAWAGGMNPPSAVLTGGGAFGGSMVLVLAVLRFATSTAE